jgi:hypothetical protein
MAFFTKYRFLFFLLLFTIINREATGQCSFTFLPGPQPYCVTSAFILYAVQDTAASSHGAYWTIAPPHGHVAISPVNHAIYFPFPIDSPGTYIITMTDTTNGSICIYTDSIHVHPNPVINGALTESGNLCPPATACWIDSSTSANSSSLYYQFDWGNYTADTMSCYTYDTPGYYYFLLTVTDSLGCYSSYSYSNAFKIGGSIVSIIPSVANGCICDSVAYTVTSWGANILTFISGGGVPDTISMDSIRAGSEDTPTITIFTAQYCNTGYMHPRVIAMSDTIGCAFTDTMAAPVVIDSPLIQPVITMSGATLSANAFTALPVSYQWLVDGDYIVIVSNACGGMSSDSVYVTGLGITNLSNEDNIMISPNPATQNCFLTIQGAADELYDAILLDMTGKKVNELFSGRKMNTPFAFSVAPYDKGVYLLQLTGSQGQVMVKKLVVE